MKMDTLKKETEKKMDDEYLKTKQHSLLCENQELKMREFFQTEFTQLKDDIFNVIRNLEKTIKNNGQNAQPFSLPCAMRNQGETS